MRFKTSGAIWRAFARILTRNSTPNYTHLLTPVKAPNYAISVSHGALFYIHFI
jgi:hypothetical protein